MNQGYSRCSTSLHWYYDSVSVFSPWYYTEGGKEQVEEFLAHSFRILDSNLSLGVYAI